MPTPSPKCRHCGRRLPRRTLPIDRTASGVAVAHITFGPCDCDGARYDAARRATRLGEARLLAVAGNVLMASSALGTLTAALLEAPPLAISFAFLALAGLGMVVFSNATEPRAPRQPAAPAPTRPQATLQPRRPVGLVQSPPPKDGL